MDYDKNTVWLLAWNSDRMPWDSYCDVLRTVYDGGRWEDNWAGAKENMKHGNRFYLIRTGASGHCGIFAAGSVLGYPYKAPAEKGQTGSSGKTVWRVRLSIETMVDYRRDALIKLTDLERVFPKQVWNGKHPVTVIAPQYVQSLDAQWRNLLSESGLGVPLAPPVPGPDAEALDRNIQDDVFPVLENSTVSPLKALLTLFCMCIGRTADFDTNGGYVVDEMENALKSAGSVPYPDAAKALIAKVEMFLRKGFI